MSKQFLCLVLFLKKHDQNKQKVSLTQNICLMLLRIQLEKYFGPIHLLQCVVQIRVFLEVVSLSEQL